MILNKMGFSNGFISLSEPKCVYYSGQVIFGTINFDLTDSTKIVALNIVHIGEANVNWTEEQIDRLNGAQQMKTINYTGHEDIFNYVHCVIGNDGHAILPNGPHSIPFAYQIPFTAPSSFHHDKGHIKYSVNASLTHVDGSKEELTKEYNVVAPIDLNTKENVEKPIIMEFDEVRSSNWFCKPRSIAIRITTPHSGYCPGEVVPITVDAQNNSNVDISKIVFMFTVKERYHSHMPKSTFIPPEEILVSKKLSSTLSGVNGLYTTYMKVPEMIAPNLENCTIIDVGYFFKVKIQFSGCYNSVEDEFRICIGLVPLNKKFDVIYHPLSDGLPIASLPDASNTTSKQYSNVAISFNPDTNFFKAKKTIPTMVYSNPKLSIAERVEGNIYNRDIDLYTSYELGYKSNVPESMLPVSKPIFPSNNTIILSQNEYFNSILLNKQSS